MPRDAARTVRTHASRTRAPHARASHTGLERLDDGMAGDLRADQEQLRALIEAKQPVTRWRGRSDAP